MQENVINKIFPQNCGDSLLILEKTQEKSNSNEWLYKCVFQKYPYEILVTLSRIKKGSVLNPEIERIEFLDKIWHQNCGDSLKILGKSKTKLGYFDCEFINYPNKVLAAKKEIKNGSVFNPQIEQVEFYQKIHLQNCGDSLKIIKKIDLGKNQNSKFLCEFVKFPIIVEAYKSEIINGRVNNPKIEEKEFTNKIWKQNCGDSLKIIEKTTQRTENSNHYLWKCEFINQKCFVFAEKGNILKGRVLNPLIEENNFLTKTFLQKCGDTLKVLRKIKNEKKGKNSFFECEFLNYPSKVKVYKQEILRGSVDNPALPWKTKTGLQKYIKENFTDKKPTLNELSKSINISLSHISNLILDYNLQSLINYFPEGSNQENDLRKYIISLDSNTLKTSDWKELKNQEIDIYIPNKKLGFEFNGNYWHSSLQKEDYCYHQKKSLLAQNKDIFILHIFEYEWEQKQEIIKSLIKSKIGIFDKKIGASKCKVKIIYNKEYQDFCNKNHLQGEAGAKVKLGLFYKDELIQVMSFGVPRFTEKFDWEIIRECSKLGYIILGGKEKLWSYFIKKYSPNSVISYCDFSKFTGDSYLKLGFKKERLNKPGFVWYDEKTNQVFWRNPYKNQEMNKKGYAKIYDCGQLVFSWNKI